MQPAPGTATGVRPTFKHSRPVQAYLVALQLLLTNLAGAGAALKAFARSLLCSCAAVAGSTPYQLPDSSVACICPSTCPRGSRYCGLLCWCASQQGDGAWSRVLGNLAIQALIQHVQQRLDCLASSHRYQRRLAPP